MRIAMLGLGKMGGRMARRLLAGGHEVVGFDLGEDARRELAGHGGEPARSLAEVVELAPPRRAVWMMLPAGEVVEQTLEELAPLMAEGDVVVDGGNSFYKDTLRRAEGLRARGIHLVDVGTSGGVWGLEEGYCMMAGGDPGAIEHLRPALETLAPAKDRGFGRVGPSGAGHFVKMVHNGIEYGLMQAYAEGFALMRRKEEFGLDLGAIAGIWRHGSVVRSWLLDLAERALAGDPELAELAPRVSDSGEGRWTVMESIELDSPAPVIALSLIERLSSRDDDSFAHKMLSALRHQFGGHAVARKEA